MWLAVARVLFWRCKAHTRRDHLNAWLFDHAPVRGGFRRGVITLGMERNPGAWPSNTGPNAPR